ncbi:mCG145050, partial [Mus musculus]
KEHLANTQRLNLTQYRSHPDYGSEEFPRKRTKCRIQIKRFYLININIDVKC